MKTFLRSFIALLLGAFILTSGIYAQDEKSVVQVKIIKDGKTIMDTTYLVEDESSTKMAVKMLDIALGEKSVEKGKKVYAFSSEEGENHEWISQDGKRQMIREKVYISSEDCDGEYVTVEVDGDGNRTIHKKVIVKKGDDGNKVKKANEVIIIKKEAAEPAEIEWIEKGEPKLLIIDDGGKEKTIKVFRGEGESSTNTIITEDGEKIIIKELKEGDGEKEIEVEVIVEDEEADVPETRDTKKEKKRKQIDQF